MNFKRYIEASDTWVDSHYIMGTSTDTLTTLPAVLYPNDTTATVGLKGNTVQSGTPSPDNPIMPQGTGDKTANLYQFPYTLTLSLSGSGNNRTVVSTAYIRSNIIKLKPNTNYYFTGQRSQAADNFGRIALFADKPKVDSVSSHFYSFSNNGSVSFTTDATENYALVYLAQPSDYETNYNMMLIEGSTPPSSYIPYGYKIPISSASTTTPVYLGEVETTRKIKKLILTGTENIKSGTGFIYVVANDAASYLATARCICTHYPQEGTEFCINTTNQIRFYVNSDVDTFKAYLAAQYANGTPVCVWYILKNEETAVINEPLMKLGDYADTLSNVSIPVTAGGDTLSIGTTVQPSEVTVNYKGWHPVADVHERDNGAWT